MVDYLIFLKMEEDLNFLTMEDFHIFLKMEANLNYFENRRQPLFLFSSFQVAGRVCPWFTNLFENGILHNFFKDGIGPNFFDNGKSPHFFIN